MRVAELHRDAQGLYLLKRPYAATFHGFHGRSEVLVSIEELETLEDTIPFKQLKMLLGWTTFHQEKFREKWEPAKVQQELFAIEPLK